jgi:formylglycine-generating enzyme required for sulfatase activity
MCRVWLSPLVLAVCALAVSFVLTESSRVAAGSKTVRAENSAVTIQASEPMTGMVPSMLYLPVVGGGSIAVSTAVNAKEGGNLSTTMGALETTIHIPPGAISENATLVVQLATAPPSSENFRRVGDVLDIQLHTEAGGSITEFLKPFTMTIGYRAEDVTEVNAELLALHYWNTDISQWQKISTTVDVGNSQLNAVLDHLTLFAVLEGLPTVPTATPTATPTAVSYTISGYVQKGPFVSGSEITVRELDAGFASTGRTFTGNIEDSTGHFTIRGTLNHPFVELSANGFYFNEVSGNLSAAPIILLALADLRDSTTVNINLLTHLERSRVFTLIGSGLSFPAAKVQAQREVLSAFNIAASAIGASESLDISQPGTGNIILLALSAILQANRGEAQLTALLSTLSSDLRTDGVLDGAATRQKLIEGMEYIKPWRSMIRANIVAYYDNLEVPANVPDFAAYAFTLDTVAPSVSSSVPGAGANQEIQAVALTFSELMQHDTLDSSTVQLLNAQGGPVAGTLNRSDSDAATTITFTPLSKLAPGTYQMVVSTGARDLAGNGLAAQTTIALTHTPLSELTAANSGTTRLGSATLLTATVPGNHSSIVYTWDFGDGTSGSGANPSKTYTAVGNYVATVTAVNGSEQATASTQVSVIDRGITGLSAANSGPTRLASTTSFTATILGGSNVSYAWAFGDGSTGSGANTSRIYAAVGVYTTVVTATNRVSQVVASTQVSVIDRAITGLSAANSGPTRLASTTSFTATILGGSNVSYAWAFGDGSTGSGANPSRTYAAVGVYTAVVTATNGVSQAVASTQVTVDQSISGLQAVRSGQGPVALGSVVVFTATTTAGSNINYTWNFGDGTTGSGAHVTRSYAVTGTHMAVVTAANSVGSSTASPQVIGVVYGWTPMEEILIPAGSFQMGCDSSNPAESCRGGEQLLHTVILDAYSIDKYEVTNARHQACVDAGGCTPPGSVNSLTRSPYYGTSTYADYPVLNVTWHQARAFCAWAGGRLPTEAEWEKAARGSSDTRKYPWGDSGPDCMKVNFTYYQNYDYHRCVGDTSRVGSYPSGASPYGVMDMAGNVWEWVNDWYSGSYYSVSPSVNPQGPATGSRRVLRGGSWFFNGDSVRSAYRGDLFPDDWSDVLGFRCVRSQ